MNQRTLDVFPITTSLNILTGTATTGGAYDLCAGDGVTTSTWTYANIGRREIKLLGVFTDIFTGTPNCTNAFGLLQSCSTGAAAGTWTYIPSSTFGVAAVTAGTMIFSAGTGGAAFVIPSIHFSTNERYIRAIYNIQGATTASVIPQVAVLLEQRAS